MARGCFWDAVGFMWAASGHFKNKKKITEIMYSVSFAHAAAAGKATSSAALRSRMAALFCCALCIVLGLLLWKPVEAEGNQKVRQE